MKAVEKYFTWFCLFVVFVNVQQRKISNYIVEGAKNNTLSAEKVNWSVARSLGLSVHKLPPPAFVL